MDSVQFRFLYDRPVEYFLYSTDFPSRFPNSERSKPLKVLKTDSSNSKLFLEAPPEYGGGTDPKIPNKTGFWTGQMYVTFPKSPLEIGSEVHLLDVYDSDLDHDKVNENSKFKILEYCSNSSSNNYQHFFIQAPYNIGGKWSEAHKDYGIWVSDDNIDYTSGKFIPELIGVSSQSKTQSYISNNNSSSISSNSNSSKQTTILSMDSLQNLAGKALIRSTSKATVKALRLAVLRLAKTFLQGQFPNKPEAVQQHMQTLRMLSTTPIGEAVLSVAVGYIVAKVPVFGTDPRVSALSEELIIEGMSAGMDQVVSVGFTHVLPELQKVLDQSFSGLNLFSGQQKKNNILSKKKATKVAKEQDADLEEEEEQIVEVLGTNNAVVATTKKTKNTNKNRKKN